MEKASVQIVTTDHIPMPAHLLDEITDYLAEALFQDFRQHRQFTVESRQGSDHGNSLTNAKKKIKSSRQ